MGDQIKYLSPLFMIPVYLRSEEQYYEEMEQAKTIYKKKHGEVQFGKRVDDWFFWPPWNVNDIVGYIQIGVDPDRLFRFLVYGIDYEGGYKKIPRYPGRRKCIMFGKEYREHFNEDFICCKDGGYLALDSPDADIKRVLKDFMSELHNILKMEKKYLNLDYWLKVIECLDIKKLLLR